MTAPDRSPSLPEGSDGKPSEVEADAQSSRDAPGVVTPLSLAAPELADRTTWLMIVRTDQHRRFQDGNHVPVETYLEHFNDQLDDEARIDLIYSEVLLRAEHGQEPTVEEYLQRFPQFDAQLRQQFEVFHALRSASLISISEDLTLSHLESERGGDAQVNSSWPQIPGYEILEKIGQGGMGAVFKAVQLGLKRIVAVKVVQIDGRTDLLSRFQREAETVARLQHPNIVQIFEVGTFDGKPFFSMEHVSGGTLADLLSGEPQPTRTAAELIHALAVAVHEAHRHRIIHRDLKPGNVLLVRLPGQTKSAHNPLIPKITDFGLAKQLDDVGELTQSGALVGTPNYMAPEQAEGKAQEMGPATDVHALGCILYETLTGAPPWRGENVVETLTRIRNEEAKPPSRVNPRVHRDLETICLKCLEKSPRQRYESAQDLAEDLERYLNGEPIHARPVNRVERLSRWCRRNPATTVATVVTALLLLVALPGWLWYRARLRQSDEAMALLEKNQRATEDAVRLQEYYASLNRARQRSALRPKGWTWAGIEDLQHAAQIPTRARNVLELRNEFTRCLAGIDIRRTAVWAKDLPLVMVSFSPDGKYLAVADHRGPLIGRSCTVRLLDGQTGKLARTLTFPTALILRSIGLVPDGARSLAFTPGGRYLLLGSRSGWVYRWSLETPDMNRIHWKALDNKPVDWLLPTPDGKAVIVGSSKDTVIARWKLSREAAKPETEVRTREKVQDLLLTPGGMHLGYQMAGEDNFRFLNATSLKALPQDDPRWPVIGIALNPACVDPTGEMVCGEDEDRICLVHRKSGSLVRKMVDPRTGYAHLRTDFICFSPDGSLILSLSFDDDERNVHLWETTSGRLVDTIIAPGTGHVSTSFHPRKDALILACDGKVELYQIGGLRVQSRVAHHALPIRDFELLPSGELVSSSQATLGQKRLQSVSQWETLTGTPRPPGWSWWRETSAGESPPVRVSAHPYSHQRVALLGEGTLGFSRNNRTWITEIGDGVTLGMAGFDRGGRRLWCLANKQQHLEARSWPDWQQKTVWKDVWRLNNGTGELYSLAPGSRYVLVGSRDGVSHLIRARDVKLEKTFTGVSSPVRSVALNREETLAASGFQQGNVTLHRIQSGEQLALLGDHTDSVTALAFSPDSGLLATGSRDSNIHLYALSDSTPKRLMTFPCSGPVQQVSFHPDGRRLAFLVQNERAVRIWHLDRLRARLKEANLDDSEWPDLITSKPAPSRPSSEVRVTIASRVWHDVNSNGTQDRNEPGHEGSVVELFTTFDDQIGNADDKSLGTGTTDAEGYFRFEKSVDRYEKYYLAIRTPPGHVFTCQHQHPDDTKDSDVNSIGFSDVFHVNEKTNIARDAGLLTGVTAVEDAGLRGETEFYKNNPEGKDDKLVVKQKDRSYALIKFDVSQIKTPVVKATLRMQWHISERAGQKVGVYRFGKPWDEATVTWNNVLGGKDPFGATIGGPLDPGAVISPPPISHASGLIAEWDVTSAVKEWQSGSRPNYGLLVRGENDECMLGFWSKERPKGNAAPPQLIITAAPSQQTPKRGKPNK